MHAKKNKASPAVTTWRQITTVLKDKKKKGLTGYDLASFLPANLFASRKAEKKKRTRNFQYDSLVLVHEHLYKSISSCFWYKNTKNKYVESRIRN